MPQEATEESSGEKCHYILRYWCVILWMIQKSCYPVTRRVYPCSISHSLRGFHVFSGSAGFLNYQWFVAQLWEIVNLVTERLQRLLFKSHVLIEY